ncbi:hypothetical protein FOFC_03106 [Fusarium oxysporum]|nr:hypothetical protein FOFC_03086 [Fusarium oxysporum]KAI8416786.1 hypothetical protein FOFC_03099 [Fusarium oxysporum]KAI8416793.1 hypothetical protein FOFC_03106 [Fusarium oxysporum]
MSDLPPPSTPAKGSPMISTPCPTPLFPSAFSRLSQPRTVAKQLEEASVGELPPNPTIEDLPKVVWKNRRFIQEDSLARKGAKGRKSWIRSHGMFFIELNHQDQPIGHVWCCSRCDTKGRPEFFSVQATSSAADHLRKAHRITPASQSSPSDDSAIDLQSHATPKRPRLDQSIIPKAKVKAVQELSVGFVIDSDVPFTIFEHKFLKELFYQFDHELALQIPWSSSSITRELQKIFESKADIIKAELGSALTKIHISFDLWTSPNRLAIMAVFAYFIDKFGNQQSRLLALPTPGENLAETLFEIVQLWDIRGQVGTVISDNVTTNDTCLSYFYRQLDPSIRPADIKARRMRCYGHVLNLVARAFLFGKDAESFELESDINGMRGLQEQDLRHWRSKGPIGKLHNIVKFIRSSPQRSEYFKRVAHEQEDEGYHLCEESTAELEVILNNETRWNSTYMMIERALRKQTDIRAYIFALEGEKDEEKRIPADDILSNEDWRVLGEVNEILTPLYHQTMRTQGWGKGDSHGRLWEVLVGMEYLLEHFEDWKGFYNEFTTETIRATNLNDPELIGRASAPLRGTNIRSARSRRRPARFDGEEVYVSQQRSQAPTFTVAALPEHSQAEYAAFDKPPASKISQKSSLPADHRAYIRASINNGWKKLDEYYSKLGESPLFAAAVILHPRFGISWLEATWATEEQLAWVRDAKAGIKDYFARWYQSNQRTDDLQSKSASSLTNRGKEDDHYTQWINSRTKKAFATSSSVSEMDKYLRLEPQDTQEPIQWWRDHKPSFPVLSSFALDVFAIPAMATDCERQFSLAKLTLTSQRLAMGADTLERVHCLRNWVRHGGVKLGSWVALFQVEERELRLWRKRGAVGKLHNIVRFVRASPQRRELMKSLACDQNDEDGYQLFEEERAAIDLELMQNNETRWNSTFLMIQRAIRKREHIDHFIAYLETKTSEPRQRVPVQDQLSPQDWLLLAEIQSLLEPLHEITMRCQGWAKEGRHGALWEVMIGMEYLLNFFEEQNLIFSSPDSGISELRNFRVSATKRSSTQRIEQGRGREKHLPQHAREEYTDVVLQDENLDDDHRRCVQISIKNCWSKLDEYYSLLGQSPLYPAAVILHPRWNVSWLEANWTSDEQLVWLRDAKNSVREFFEQHYPREEQPETSRTVTGKAVRQDEPSQFDQWMQSCDRCMMEEEDELGVYMRQGPVRRENLNPVLWWKDHQEEYPRLSKFALDILAIPAMSVDPERTFSVTKLTVSSQRHSISPEIIEEMQCLRNWLRHQAITMGEVVSFGGDLVGWEGGEA